MVWKNELKIFIKHSFSGNNNNFVAVVFQTKIYTLYIENIRNIVGNIIEIHYYWRKLSKTNMILSNSNIHSILHSLKESTEYSEIK